MCQIGPKPYKFIGFGDINGPKPYKFTVFGDINGPTPYKFTLFGIRILVAVVKSKSDLLVIVVTRAFFVAVYHRSL